jgi:transcriptional regulator GlxA family with amidase domain
VISRQRSLRPSDAASTIVASSGLSVSTDHTIADKMRFDTVLVCAGGNPASFDDPKTLGWLRGVARSGGEIGGVGGPFKLDPFPVSPRSNAISGQSERNG